MMSRNNIIGLVSLNILFWIAVYLIGLGVGFEWYNPPFRTTDGNYAPTFLWGTFFNAIVFYTNAFWGYPLKKQRNWRWTYWILVFCFLLLVTIIEANVDLWLIKKMNLMQKVYDETFGQEVPDWVIIFGLSIQIFYVHIFFFILSFLNVFYVETLKNEQIQQTLEQEKLKSELKFLKAQINPHFLFNGVNSVYHLIDPKPEIAKSTLLKFSNLLRYQLYECNDDLIPLEKELEHIRDYVEMEKIRKGGDAHIHLVLPEETAQINIPPLLFTPFIENAFKYVSNHNEGSKNHINIKIRLEKDGRKLRFETENTIDENKSESNGGIGIANVKKRLALLFPRKHDLDIIKEADRFEVRLSLNLK